MSKKSVQDFEDAHGGGKIHSLQDELEAERKKLELVIAKQRKPINIVVEEPHLRFGVTGDRHFGSLFCHDQALKAYYELCEERGIDLVLDTGDITDGHKVYRGHEFELRDLGFDRQLGRVEEENPVSTEIKTKFITGNHDGSFKSIAGASMGNAIEDRCPGYEFVGEDQARVEFKTPNGPYSVMLLHPSGGTAYAISYRAQKIVESLEGGTKPDMLCIGHYHKAEFLPHHRNVSVLQSGTFQRQTPFMAKMGSPAHVGGWLVEVTVGKEYNIVKAEFVAFYG